MTTYEITVNGKSYDVTVQKKKKVAAAPVSDTKSVPVATAPVVSAVKVAAPAVATSSSSTKVTAPMPGKIITIKVKVGERVEKGQEMIIMEAMKMHNPILAAHDGVITEIFVQINDPVQSGQMLLAMN